MRHITDLPHEAFDKLCTVLGKETTINWEKVMTEGFPFLYSPKHVEEIRQKRSPADALLNDLSFREVPLEYLYVALREIGNKKAVSIINKGSQLSCLYALCLMGCICLESRTED